MVVQTSTMADEYAKRRPEKGCRFSNTKRKPKEQFYRSCCLGIAVLVIILAVMAGHAWSFEKAEQAEAQGGGASSLIKASSSSWMPSCHAFLDNIKTLGSVSDMDPETVLQAGGSSSPGFVFGVRFALSPPKPKGAQKAPSREMRLDFWHPYGSAPNAIGGTFDGHRHILAIMAFKECQKAQAMNALKDFSWSR